MIPVPVQPVTAGPQVLSLSNCALDATLGSGKTRLRWAKGLRAAGFQVQALAPADIMQGSVSQTGRRFRLALKARALGGTKTCDLLECCGAEFGLLQRRLFRHVPRPLIVAHTDGLELLATERKRGFAKRNLRQTLAAPLHAWLELAGFRYADALVTLCQADLAHARKRGLFDESNSACINPGIDAEYLNLELNTARENLVVYLGTWHTRKAPARIARVMTRVLEEEPSCRFEVIGASGDQQRIMEAFPLELHNRIKVHGKLPSTTVSECLRQAKVMFFPSHYEGFGMAVTEAMACGCAVVTTPTGFGSDLRDGHEAFVRDFDDESGMKENILRLLRDDAVRVPMAESGWRRVQALSWDAQGRRLADLYAGWLARWDQERGCWRRPLEG